MSGKKKSFLDFFKMDDNDSDIDDYSDDVFDEDDEDEDDDDYAPSFSFKNPFSKGGSGSQSGKSVKSRSRDDEDDYDDYDEAPRGRAAHSSSSKRSSYSGSSYTGSSYSGGSYSDSSYQGYRYGQSQSSAGKSDNLVSFNNSGNAGKYSSGQSASSSQTQSSASKNYQPKAPAKTSTSNYTSGSEVYVIKPVEIDDAQTVADFLKRERAIVINMEGLPIDNAQRIIDFIGGACYGLGGELKAISANIFIAVPENMEVSGDFRDEIMNSSYMSPNLGE